jgi:hypothetical protein
MFVPMTASEKGMLPSTLVEYPPRTGPLPGTGVVSDCTARLLSAALPSRSF